MYAVIDDRGKQYKVKTGDRLLIDLKPSALPGDTLEFNKVLMLSDESGNVSFDTSANKNAKVLTVVEGIKKTKKCMTIKFRRRKSSMTRRGHRQKYTQVTVKEILTE